MEHYDIIIIGGGPSGYAGAMRAIDFGKKVLLIEKKRIGGAGIYGSPLHGAGSWANFLRLFLLTGPMTLFPASLLAIWRPRSAGIWLVFASFVSAVFAVLVMRPLPTDLVSSDYVFKWSMALIVPFSLPLFALGWWLLASHAPNHSAAQENVTDELRGD